jgi:hypothetical protein
MSRTAKLWSAFLPQWVVANVVGWIFYSFIDALKFNFIGFGLGIGLFISIFQWLVLNKHMGVDTMWIWVSSLTYGIYIISLALASAGLRPFLISLSLVSGGLKPFLVSTLVLVLIGFLQRSVLDYYFDNSGRWIIASGIAGASALTGSSIIASLFLSEIPLPIVWGIYGGIYGTITGVILVSMYPQPIGKALT